MVEGEDYSPEVERGRRIAKARKDLGLTQDFVAQEVGVRRAQVSLWETGDAVPGGANLTKLSRLLQRTPEWIMDGGDLPAWPPEWRIGPSTDSGAGAIRDSPPAYRVVPIDESGLPLEDELEVLRGWISDDAMRRMSRHTTPRAWLGMLYAHGTHEGWPAERLDRIDSARRRVDELRRAEDSPSGPEPGS